MSTAGEPLHPSLAPRSPGRHLSDATLDAVARMYVSGGSIAMIAAATGLSAARIRTLVADTESPRIEACRGEVLRATATHYFEMLGMLGEVRTNIRGGLGSAEEKVRLETSKWLHEQMIPRPTQRADTEQRHSLSPELQEVFTGIATTMARLADAKLSDQELRVRKGLDALPRPMIEQDA